MRFIPIKAKDREEMLNAIGASSISSLFSDIPEDALIGKPPELPPELNEIRLGKEIEGIAGKNRTAKQLKAFIGAGCYNHSVPAAVPAITGRSEFYTAYTPYQAEASQGLLQAIFEWQTYICSLTGMDLANASMYDGASASAEAVLMAKKATGRNKVLVCNSLNPFYKAVVKTYANAAGVILEEVKLDQIGKHLDEETACVLVQQPDFFGRVLKLQQIEKQVHEKSALLVLAVAEALSLAFVEKPSDCGADIVAVDAQSFGNPMSFGGPAVGVIACRKKFMRLIPGRLVGRTQDAEGKPGFILTLQTREQHIRRERATSNICSNQALCALASTVYLALLGEKGLKELAGENNENAAYLAGRLEALGFSLPFGKGFFNEFVVKVKDAGKVQARLLEKGIVFGYSLGNDFPEVEDYILVAVTELNSRADIDMLVKELEAVK